MKNKSTKTSKSVKNTASRANKITRKGGMSKIAVPATGAVIGAAIGTAAGAVLTNDEAKKTIKGVADTLGEYASDALDAIEENKGKLEEVAEDTANKTVEKIRS